MSRSKPPFEGRLQEPLSSYWLERVAEHTDDSYAGIPMSKFPEDLRVYEHLLWADRPSAIIELGTQYGGSALWFRDRLRTLASYGHISDPHVVTIDIGADHARPFLDMADPSWSDDITLLTADIRDRLLPERVAEILPADARCFVVEDAAHLYETTIAALSNFAGFVPIDGFFIVEDGCVDVEQMRLTPDWPRGVLPALDDWLKSPSGRRFVVRRDLELYGLTCHPRGILQRTS